MKTLVVDANGILEVREIPKPRYTSKQALVRTVACGICGTDTTLINRQFKGFSIDTYPIMLGHEGVGQVVELGSEVTSFKVGDYVLLPFNDPNKALYEDLGSGWGAFSEYGVVNDLEAYPEGEAPDVAYAQQVIPEDIDPVDAVMIVTLREVLSNIKYFGVGKEDTIVVYGGGPVGVTFISFMKFLGIENIIAIDINEEKRQFLLKVGAKKAYNSTVSDITKEIRAAYPDGVGYVLDAVGSFDIINEAMGLIKDRGEILCYGIPKSEKMELDFSKASYNWKIAFQQMPRKKEEGEVYQQILDWIREGKIELKDFISDYFKFEDILEAFEKHGNCEIMKKGIVVYK